MTDRTLNTNCQKNTCHNHAMCMYTPCRAPKVEWVPISENYNGSMTAGQDIYISDGQIVRTIKYGNGFPAWVTHWAPCPPRTLPAPPQEAAP